MNARAHGVAAAVVRHHRAVGDTEESPCEVRVAQTRVALVECPSEWLPLARLLCLNPSPYSAPFSVDGKCRRGPARLIDTGLV